MFPEQVFQNQFAVVPEIIMEVLRHIDICERVICAHCKINGLKAKRLTQESYGAPVNEIPVWSLEDRIVANWFASILESKYQEKILDQTIIIHSE